MKSYSVWVTWACHLTFKMGIISQDCCEDSSKYVSALCRHKKCMAFIVGICFYFNAKLLHVLAALFLVVLIRKGLNFLGLIF